MDVNVGDDFPGLWNKKDPYKHVPDFEMLRIHNRFTLKTKVRITENKCNKIITTLHDKFNT
jgi:hypothetical protein